MRQPRSFAPWILLSLTITACSHAVMTTQMQSATTPQIQSRGITIEKRATIAIDHPAFLNVINAESQNPQLLVSSFGVFGGDAVRRVTNLKGILSGQNPQIETLTTQVTWPNEVIPAPNSIAPQSYLVAGGFLVPGKTGALTLVESNGRSRALTAEEPVTEKKGGWFYHRTVWRDMNGDGQLDILTARAKKPMLGPTESELLWLSAPSRGATWTEHVIAKGPDVNFRLVDLDGDGREEVIAAEFFSKTLNVYWQEGGAWRSRVVDTRCGAAFDLAVGDLNGDGRRDIVLTNHENGPTAGAFAYEVPTDWKNTLWPRHTVAQGIPTRQGGPNQAAPGAPLILASPDGSKKPLILLSGDGSQRVHLLTPASNASNDWNYALSDLADLGCTVGQLEAADLDGDSAPEILAPAYDKHQVHIFTLRSGSKKRTR